MTDSFIYWCRVADAPDRDVRDRMIPKTRARAVSVDVGSGKESWSLEFNHAVSEFNHAGRAEMTSSRLKYLQIQIQ
jgi:hypothetical protein